MRLLACVLFATLAARAQSVDRSIDEIGRMGEGARPHLPRILHALYDADPSVRSGAISAMGSLEGVAWPLLPFVRELAEEDLYFKSSAGALLKQWAAPEDAPPPTDAWWLLGRSLARGEQDPGPHLEDPHPYVRHHAFEALLRMDPPPFELLQRAKDRRHAVMILWRLSPKHREAADLLLPLMDAEDDLLAQYAWEGVRRWRLDLVVAAMGRRLSWPDSARRTVAIANLEALGEAARPILPQLIEMLYDPSPSSQVLVALKNLREHAAPAGPYLRERATAPDMHEALRPACLALANALGATDPAPLPPMPDLRAALRDRSLYVRAMATRRLEREGERGAAILVEALADASLRWRAAFALGRMRAASAVPALLAMLDGTSDEALAALVILGEIGVKDPEIARRLIAVMESAELRGHALTVLGRMGEAAGVALPTLGAMLDREETRQIAVHTLVSLGSVGAPLAEAVGRAARPGDIWTWQALANMGNAGHEALARVLREGSRALQRDAARFVLHQRLLSPAIFAAALEEPRSELASILNLPEALAMVSRADLVRLADRAPTLVTRIGERLAAEEDFEAIREMMFAEGSGARKAAGVALGRLGPKGAPLRGAILDLLRAVEERGAPDVKEFLPHLVTMGDPVELGRALRDPSRAVRVNAGIALRTMKQAALPAIDLVGEAYADPATFETILSGVLVSFPGEALPYWYGAMRNGDARMRKEAERQLPGAPGAFAFLAARLDTNDPAERLLLAPLLARCGGECIDLLGPRIPLEPHPRVRDAFVSALLAQNTAVDRIIPHLMAALELPACWSVAAKALRSLGDPATAALTAAAETGERPGAALVLADQGQLRAEFLPLLLASEDATSRSRGVELCITAGPAAKGAVPVLRRMLLEAAPAPRLLDLLYALASIGTDAHEAEDELHALYATAPEALVPAIRCTLSCLQFGPTTVVDLIESERKEYVDFGWGLLARQKEIGVPVLAMLLPSTAKGVRERAQNSLVAFGAAAVSVFVELLSAEDPALRVMGADALGRLKAVAAPALPDLIAALEDRNDAVLTAVVRALGAMGAAARPAIPRLRDLGRHARYQSLVAETLRQIDAGNS